MQLCMADEFNNQLPKVRYILIVFLKFNLQHLIPKKTMVPIYFYQKCITLKICVSCWTCNIYVD